MPQQTVRVSLRDAMAGEVAEYQGAYKVTGELLAELGSKRVVDPGDSRNSG